MKFTLLQGARSIEGARSIARIRPRPLFVRCLRYLCFLRSGLTLPVDPCDLSSTRSLYMINFLTACLVYMKSLTIFLGSARDIHI